MSKPYTLDTFTFDVSSAVAKELDARKRFAEDMLNALATARVNQLPSDKTLQIAVAAIRQLSDESIQHLIFEAGRQLGVRM